MNKQEELRAMLALTQIPGIGNITAKRLVENVSCASDIFLHRTDLEEMIPDIQPKLIKALDCPAAFKRADIELDYMTKNHIRCFTLNDEEYPSRLRDCDDAPLTLFYLGNANLNSLHIVSMVGTRKATEYGRDICESFVRDLAQICPDVLVVSGLAYGIDVESHRNALKNGLSTVGVLAHGLDRIYPATHRRIAGEMVGNGGLLTEYMSFTEPDRQNFVQRNRIVAGMADATIVVESAAQGGSLITAELAESYHRDCFTFPGRVDDEYSRGCNNLIRSNRAALITNADDFTKAMGWDNNGTTRQEAVQRQLFVELSPEEEKVMNVLRRNKSGFQINTLVIETDIPVNRLSSLLFEMEMKGLLKTLAGGVYKAVL